MSLMISQALDRGWEGWSPDNEGHIARFPNRWTTGWEATGTTLTPYTGTHFMDADAVIEDKRIIVEAFYVTTPGITVTLRRCWITGHVECYNGGTLILEDCNIDAGPWVGPALGYRNLTVRRCAITGGQHSIMGTHEIDVQDSWLHSQFNDPTTLDGYHNNAFISNGGSNVLLKHNMLDCATALTPNGGGPTGAASIHGDFEPIDNVIWEDNYFAWTTGSFVLWLGWGPGKPFGTDITNIQAINNVFERRKDKPWGGLNGTITSRHHLATDPGWDPEYYQIVEGNVFEDNGAPVDVG